MIAIQSSPKAFTGLRQQLGMIISTIAASTGAFSYALMKLDQYYFELNPTLSKKNLTSLVAYKNYLKANDKQYK